MTLRERAANLKRDIPAVFLALKSQKTPIFAKILAAVTVAYALSPIDLIPDFIPVLGYLDDVLLLPGLVALTLRLIPEEVLTECRIKAQDMWQGGRPKKWYYALPVLIFWCLVLLAILRGFLK
ncbi:MAG: YkvA family protein [Candidatus Faecousia sp.]|nr:YkvA family protein [Candidatus Faecousia sp.]